MKTQPSNPDRQCVVARGSGTVPTYDVTTVLVLCGPFEANLISRYRLYNPNTFVHFWTTDANEYDTLGTIGWRKESIAGHLFQTQVTGSVPLYRLYNPGDGNHHWTMDIVERDSVVNAGWNDEGIAGYVFGSED